MRRVIILPVIAAGAFVSVALAQAASGPLAGFLPNLAEWYASPFALAATVAIIVQFLKEHVLTGLSGASTIIASFAVGGLLGLAGHLSGFLLGGVVEAVAFGLVSAFIASGGYDLVRALLEKWGVALSPAVPTSDAGAASGTRLMAGSVAPVAGGVLTGVLMTARDYIFSLLSQRFGEARMPAAIAAVAPLLAEFAQSDMVLTDERRSEIQARVLTLLRSAGLEGVDLR